MHRILLLTLTLAALPLGAADIYSFSLLPTDGNVAGTPGSTIGWGYSLTNQSSTYWLVTSGLNAGSFQNATPNLIFDFPDLAPGATVTVPFNAAMAAGLYELTWGSSAPLNFTNTGTFVLSAQWWNGNPLGNGTFVTNAPNASQAYAATVTPEPATGGTIGLCLLALPFAFNYRKGNSI